MSESDRVVSFAQSHMCMGCFEVVRVSVLKVREWVSFHMNPEISLDGVCPKCGYDSTEE